jgi:hypothetical protein
MRLLVLVLTFSASFAHAKEGEIFEPCQCVVNEMAPSNNKVVLQRMEALQKQMNLLSESLEYEVSITTYTHPSQKHAPLTQKEGEEIVAFINKNWPDARAEIKRVKNNTDYTGKSDFLAVKARGNRQDMTDFMDLQERLEAQFKRSFSVYSSLVGVAWRPVLH